MVVSLREKDGVAIEGKFFRVAVFPAATHMCQSAGKLRLRAWRKDPALAQWGPIILGDLSGISGTSIRIFGNILEISAPTGAEPTVSAKIKLAFEPGMVALFVAAVHRLTMCSLISFATLNEFTNRIGRSPTAREVDAVHHLVGKLVLDFEEDINGLLSEVDTCGVPYFPKNSELSTLLREQPILHQAFLWGKKRLMKIEAAFFEQFQEK